MIGRETILSVKIGNNTIFKHFYLMEGKDIIILRLLERAGAELSALSPILQRTCATKRESILRSRTGSYPKPLEFLSEP